MLEKYHRFDGKSLKKCFVFENIVEKRPDKYQEVEAYYGQ
jgi:hypothetical protein